MIIEQLDVNEFRNISQASLTPHPRLNLITGDNAAGKSALLEAIQCMATGHSFRTRRARELIRREASAFTLTARFRDPSTDRDHRCGLKRHRDGTVELRLDYEEIRSQAEVTRLLPVMALTPDSHRLIQEGPDERRQFLDWGVFHVEPRFLGIWKQFRRSLSQRNQLLREQAPSDQIQSWNTLLATSANELDSFRHHYVDMLAEHLQYRLKQLPARFHVELRYRRGWSIDNDLESLLLNNLDNHRRMKTTTEGPHRAEITFNVDDVAARQYLSRGQQKVLVYLLHLSQLDVLSTAGESQAIVLCDDLAAELDDTNAVAVIDQLLQLNGQVFVSGINLDSLRHHPHKAFHVEHGLIRNVV